MLAHIGNIPVEEWLPFLVPVLLLYADVRRKERKRRRALQRIPDPQQVLDTATVQRVIERWKQTGRVELSAAHVALLYPPGPEGKSAADLSERLQEDPAGVHVLLEELEDFGYLTLERRKDDEPLRAWLTIEGNLLQYDTEAVLLAAVEDATRHEQDYVLRERDDD